MLGFQVEGIKLQISCGCCYHHCVKKKESVEAHIPLKGRMTQGWEEKLRPRTGEPDMLVQISLPPLSNWVTLGKMFTLPMLEIPHL